MGTFFACTCKDCGHDFRSYEGVGRYSQPLICSTCGTRAYIPRVAPRPNRYRQRIEFEKMVKDGAAVASAYPDLNAFNRDELKKILESKKPLDGMDAWLDEELMVLVELRNPCACGGTLDLASKTERNLAPGVSAAPNSLVRCPECRSMDYSFAEQGLWD